MYLTSYLQDGKLTISLTGEIDHHCAKEYMHAISGKLEAYSPKACVLDFQDVTFMDSSGIAIVINTLRQMGKLEGRLLIGGMKDQPMRVFRAAGIDKLIEIEEVLL